LTVPAERTNGAILRWLVDPPLDGALNMARDEAILQAVNAGRAPATLRLYQWREPTISLGYFQSIREVQEQDSPVATLPVVRRQTGGGAILHDWELTYSLVLPLGEGDSANIERMYTLVHDAMRESLASFGVAAEYRGIADEGNSQRGPFFCFARKHRLDLVIGPDKVLGSAQRRIRQAALQHGSLILDSRFEQQPCAAVRRVNPDLDLDGFRNLLSRAIADRLSRTLLAEELTDSEWANQKLLVAKYKGWQWTGQR